MFKQIERLGDVTFSSTAFPLLKKLLESVLECTEYIRVNFSGNVDHPPVVIQSLDALWICQCSLVFDRRSFAKWHIQKDLQSYVYVNAKEMHRFLKSCKLSKNFRLILGRHKVSKKLHLYYAAGEANNALKLASEISDDGCDEHYQWNSDLSESEQWPSFRVSSNEFHNICLDAIVGAGDIQVSMNGGRALFFTRFEGGCIEHELYQEFDNTFRLVNPAKEKEVKSDWLIVKFLKMACAACSISDTVTVAIESTGRLAIKIRDSTGMVHYEFMLSAYHGPRGQWLPAEYISYASRVI